MAKPTPAPSAPTMDVSSERFHHLTLENDAVRVFRVQVPPGEETWMHRHERDYAFIILARAEIREQRQGGEPEIVHLEAGQVLFRQGGFAHQVRNVGSEPFRAVIVEVKR